MRSSSAYLMPALFLTLLASCLMLSEGKAYGGTEVGPLSLLSGPSPFEEGCDGGPSFGWNNYHNYEVEPYVAVNPLDLRNIVVSWQQDRWSWGGANGIIAAVTRDGGATWKQVVIPGVSRCSGGPAERTGDPWLTFAANGDLYSSAMTMNAGSTGSAVLVSKSTDGGETWGLPVIVHADATPSTIDDKESITADPEDPRLVYAVWSQSQFASGTPQTMSARHAGASKVTSWFSRTADGGTTWEPGRMIFDPGEHSVAIGHQIAVLPNGDLINAFALISDKKNAGGIRGMNVAVMRSNDKGETWSEPIIVERLNAVYVDDPTTGEWLVTGSTIIDVAVDKNSGTLYLVWEDGRFGAPQRIEGIAFMKSADGGLTWSAPVQVNKAAYAPAFTPSVAVAADGTIAVSYYDLRSDTSDPLVLETEHWVVVSRDGGDSWEEVHVAGPFDMRSAPAPGAPWYFVGDYVGLVSSGDSFVAAFPMANSGDFSNPTDIFFTNIIP